MVRDWDTIRNILEKIEDETLFDLLKEVETEVRFKKTDNRFRYELKGRAPICAQTDVVKKQWAVRKGGFFIDR